MTVKLIYLALLGVLLCFARPHLHAQPTVRQFVGANLTAEDDLDKARRFAHLREFHAWADDISILPAVTDTNGIGLPSCPFEGDGQQLRWNPSYNQNRYIRYDQFYGALPQKVSVVTQGAAPSMLGGGFANDVKDGKPICRSGSPSGSFNTWAYHQNPLAYKEQTIWQSLFAARYGAAPAGGFPAGFGNVASTYIAAPDNIGLGLGLVREMENFNEQDASWNDAFGLINGNNVDANVPWSNGLTTYFFAPAEYAAMLSANYDGNCQSGDFKIPGTDGFWGIKNLSPETQVVMSGTADLRKRYINEIILACQTLRPGCTLPFDVFNMHHYPTTGQPAMNTDNYNKMLNGVRIFDSGEGVNPEAPDEMLKQRILNTLNGLTMNGKGLWITELGYDSHGGTNVSVPVVGPFDRQTVQGQWLTRCVFELLATKSVDRLYLYHMQDEAGTGLFTHTGVLDQFGKPKKSWYHLMTQLNVLGDYNYVETANNDATRTKFFTSNTPANPGSPLQHDIPRIYKFLKGGDAQEPVYALWSPSKDNVTYPGMLFIPKPYQAFIISSVLKIEVQDLDENGKRTLLPIGDIQAGSHAGQDGFFIKNLTITETPLYLKFNGKTDISDPVAQPVNNLQVSSVCCGAARLTWAITMPNPMNPSQNIPEVTPGTVVSRWFQVYYAKKSDLNNVPVFDLSRLTTVEERLPGHFRECIVTGLEAGVEYYFFVLPVRDVAVSNDAFVKGLLPVIPTTLEAGKHYVLGTMGAGCGTTCLLSLGTDFEIKGPEGLQTATNQAFGLGESDSTKCANLVVTPEVPKTETTPFIPAMIVPTGGIYMDPNGPLSLTYTVAFPAPKLLQAIYFVHGYGGPAKIRIEVLEDCCDQWKFVKELDILAYNNVFVLANSQLNFRRIEQIRFIITRHPNSNPGLPRIYFCGSPATEICPGTSNGQPGYLTGPAGLTVKDIDTRSATIAWTPGKDKDLLPIARYRLRYGVATDVQGNIVNPKEVYQNANGSETIVEQTLGGLTPSTLYYTDVDVDPATKGCTATPASLRTIFTTKDVVKIERGQTKTAQPAPAQLSVQPNPASQTVTVRSSEAGYINWTLTYANGIHIRGGKVESGVDLTLDLSTLPPGLYIVTFLGGKNPPVARTFVVQR